MPNVSPLRRRALFRGSLSLAAAALLGSAASLQAQAPRNYATLAMVAEPQTLDPMASTADLVGTIMQHVYETLYTFDAKWNAVPMLAETLPKVSADGKSYTITLRKGVLLHSGRELNADDVVASLQRWMEQSPRGKALGKGIGEPAGQGSIDRGAGAEAALCAAGFATCAAQRHGRDHGQGDDRHAAGQLRRHGTLPLQGAQARCRMCC